MNKLIKYTFLILIFCLPLTFTTSNSELFEFPKIILIYFFTTLLLTFHLINYANGHKPLFQKNQLNFIFLLFLLSQFVSTYFSIDRHMSIFGYYSRFNGGLLSIICFFILSQIIQLYTDKDFTQNIINTSILSAFFVCLYAIGQHLGIDKHLWVQDVQNRVFSTLGQPNWLAAYLAIILCFVLQKIDSRPSFLNFFLLLIVFLSLLFTKSKSGLIAISIPLFYFFITHLNIKKSLPFTLLIILPILIFDNPILPAKQTNITTSTPTTEILNITPSQDIRKIVWQGAIDLWKKFPLFGTGVETFAISYYWVRPVSHNLTSEWDFLYNKAHNEYLNYAATTGTLGLGLYLTLIIFCLLSFKNDRFLLLSYITILITNFAGFSVAVTSLYFFLLPFIVFPSIKQTNFKRKQGPIYFVIPASLITIIYIISYFIADTNYFLSRQFLSKYPKNSLEKINISLKLRPNEPEYLLQSAETLTYLYLANQNDQYLSKALTQLSQAEKISPYHPNYLKKSAQILFNLKKYQTAVDIIKKTTLLCPTDAKSFYILGMFYQSTGNNNLAIPAFSKAIELKSNYDHAHYQLAQIYFDQKKYQNSLDHYQAAYTINPKNQDAYQKIQQLQDLL